MGETRLQREARHREVETRRAIGRALRDLREDAGLTITAVAGAAGIHPAFLGRIERGERAASLGVLNAVATVLGADLSLKAFANTGPRIHDRFQAPMGEGLVAALDSRWTFDPEVVVLHPARGVIDLVLTERATATIVATEVQSEIRRLEAQVRWHREKELSLASADLWPLVAADVAPNARPVTSRLLVVRSTRDTREIANRFEATLRAAYPARARDVVAALESGDAPWPGAGIAWMRVDGGRAVLLDGPPKGVRLGR
jgi:transcriptional regulator with XRE-family HTH domain